MNLQKLLLFTITLIVLSVLSYSYISPKWEQEFSDLAPFRIATDVNTPIKDFELNKNGDVALLLTTNSKLFLYQIDSGISKEITTQANLDSVKMVADIYGDFWLSDGSSYVIQLKKDGNQIEAKIEDKTPSAFTSGVRVIKFKDNYKKTEFVHSYYIFTTLDKKVRAITVVNLGEFSYEDIVNINYDFLVEKGGGLLIDDKKGVHIEKHESQQLKYKLFKKQLTYYELRYKDRTFTIHNYYLTPSRFLVDNKDRVLLLESGNLYAL